MDKNQTMNQPKVSVIIPVYNTEAYVEEAVRSVMNQTLKEIEIIIINDGSTDNSISILEKLATEDNRIQLYYQTNQGLSVTRNRGIDIANGDFIHFLDSDDLILPDMYERCYHQGNTSQSDFLFFDANVFSESSDIQLGFNYQRTYLFKEGHVYSGIDMLGIMLDKQIYRASACLNFIKREFLMQYKLNFYPNIVHEDELFTAQLYLYAQRVVCIRTAFYCRRVRKGSIMASKFSFKNINGYMTVIKQLDLLIEGDEKVRATTEKLIVYILNPAIYKSKDLRFGDRIRIFLDCIKFRYIQYIKLKNIIVFLFPMLVTIKSIMKR